jgi:hypothetical protein
VPNVETLARFHLSQTEKSQFCVATVSVKMTMAENVQSAQSAHRSVQTIVHLIVQRVLMVISLHILLHAEIVAHAALFHSSQCKENQ